MITRRQRIKFIIKAKMDFISVWFRYHKKYLTDKQIMKRYRWKHLKSMITRKCQGAGSGRACLGGKPFLKHSNCAYVDELSNYNYCCKDCHEEIDAIYQEWWDEYNASRY